MKRNWISVALSMSTLLVALTAALSARAADDQVHKLGDHPAVVVQRLYKNAGYDYASKFYPHPAWLHLYATQPRDEVDVAAASKTKPAQLSVAPEKREGS